MTWRARVGAAALPVGAAVVMSLLAARALLRCDDSWDTWAYHLPFAARLWDIVPRSSFEMDDHLELLFRAYPQGVEWVGGALWKLTGRPQAASIVGLSSLIAFVELLRRRFGVSRARSVFALLAIPMVQIHATTAYVDLPANLAAAAAVLSSFKAWTDERPSPTDVSLAMACASFAASSKFQMVGVAVLVALSAALVLLRRSETRAPTTLAVCALALCIGSYPYLKNAIVFGAPFFPIHLASLLNDDAGSLTEYQGPRHLAGWPGAARWASSVLGSGELDPERGMFSVDASSADPGGPTSLMGGYFGPWVVCQLVFLWRLNRSGSRAARGAALCALALTLLTAVSPQAHQLRYYAYWMLVLVALNLARLETLPAGAAFGARVYTGLSLVCFALVVVLTRGRHLAPISPDRPIARMVERRVPTAVLGRLRPGGRYCLVGEPFPPLALSAELLGRGHYSLKSSKDVAGCADRTLVFMTPDAEASP